jgi:hypothetical protein
MFRRIRKFDPEKRDQAVEILIGSFLESPIFVYAMPDIETRRLALYHLFLASLTDAERFGVIDVLYEDEKILSIFVYYPPEQYPPSFFRTLRVLPYYLKLMRVALRGVWRLYRAH